jgi:hypothetical protein
MNRSGFGVSLSTGALISQSRHHASFAAGRRPRPASAAYFSRGASQPLGLSRPASAAATLRNSSSEKYPQQQPLRPRAATHGNAKVVWRSAGGSGARDWIYETGHEHLIKGLQSQAPHDMQVWARRRRQQESRMRMRAKTAPQRRPAHDSLASGSGDGLLDGRMVDTSRPGPVQRVPLRGPLKIASRSVVLQQPALRPVSASAQKFPPRTTRQRALMREMAVRDAQRRAQLAEMRVHEQMEAAREVAAAWQMAAAPSTSVADAWYPPDLAPSSVSVMRGAPARGIGGLSDKEILEARLANIESRRQSTSSLQLYAYVRPQPQWFYHGYHSHAQHVGGVDDEPPQEQHHHPAAVEPPQRSREPRVPLDDMEVQMHRMPTAPPDGSGASEGGDDDDDSVAAAAAAARRIPLDGLLAGRRAQRWLPTRLPPPAVVRLLHRLWTAPMGHARHLTHRPAHSQRHRPRRQLRRRLAP